MSLYELMLQLRYAFLAALSPKGKHGKKMGSIVQEKNSFTQGPEKSTKR